MFDPKDENLNVEVKLLSLCGDGFVAIGISGIDGMITLGFGLDAGIRSVAIAFAGLVCRAIIFAGGFDLVTDLAFRLSVLNLYSPVLDLYSPVLDLYYPALGL
jgi:hypothetical protein